MRATLGQIEPALEDSARSLGIGPLRTLWRVTLPLGPARARRRGGARLRVRARRPRRPLRCCCRSNLYTLGTEFQANSSTVAFAAAAPFAAVLIVLAMVAAYVLMSRFGKVRELEAG